jgi:hypothetical protein
MFRLVANDGFAKVEALLADGLDVSLIVATGLMEKLAAVDADSPIGQWTANAGDDRRAGT